ncbi:MAG: hypothetical protein EOP85_00395 [Verrucomicrobiaceae bacterium]|nr:MAG: hypothetical protein EOP85_00395 [Verrucomicrobiaceae bacterium]
MDRFKLIALFPFALLCGCEKPECVNEVREVIVSPDGRNQVIIFTRDCGATTSFNCQGSIFPVDVGLPDESGNAFSMDKGEAEVRWKDARTVVVSVAAGKVESARFFRKLETVGEIRVEYANAGAKKQPGEEADGTGSGEEEVLELNRK